LPEGVAIGTKDEGIRFIGDQAGLVKVSDQLRLFGKDRSVPLLRVGDWVLTKSNIVYRNPRRARSIWYSSNEWRAFAGVVLDVVDGRFATPMFFGQTGVSSKQAPDVGVSLLGPVNYSRWIDPDEMKMSADKWTLVEQKWAAAGLGTLLRISSNEGPGLFTWTADYISLSTGDCVRPDALHAPTLAQLVDRLAEVEVTL